MAAVGQTSPSGYVAALRELTELRDQLVAGTVGPEDVERLTAQAADAVQAGRAALRRAAAAVDRLDAVVEGGAPPSDR